MLGFKEHGKENSTTVLFVHGSCLSNWMWQPQIEQMRNYHCLVPDLPEHQGSFCEKPFTISNSAEQLAELIRKKAHDKYTHVVGLSLGGQVVIQLLSIAPELIQSAMVSGVLVKPALRAKLLPFVTMLCSPFQSNDYFLRTKLKQLGIPMMYFNEFKKDSLILYGNPLQRILKENAEFRIPTNISECPSRLLSLVGEKESRFMIQSCRDIGDAFPNSQACVVDGMKHHWSFHAPALFTKTVVLWIESKKLPKELRTLN